MRALFIKRNRRQGNMKLFISTGNSRMEKRWNGREMELEEFIGRISTTIRTSETVE